ncbi:MAG TPA: hypothetical protein VF755_30385, partial [Catenuloplanes sp.]
MGLDEGFVTELDLPRTLALRVLGNGVPLPGGGRVAAAAVPPPVGGARMRAQPTNHEGPAG